ncbi:39S ribosomal protein L10, mitochondrial-like [Oppia nitens]|uniref:39S ribosomal protein L10, mitochondrial-like n=1 Tax=Oppia nitens TaxID=1686743 RepID=UPI0023DCAF74|nr:39S ribosomal protein L10, mitochondrial-like [Oppia nitens]
MTRLVPKLWPFMHSLGKSKLKINVPFGVYVLTSRANQTSQPRKYTEVHFRRKQMLAVCEPILMKDKRLPSEKCFNLTPIEDRGIHPLDKLLANDMKHELKTSHMICFFHQNLMTNREKKGVKNMFEHQDMYLRYYNPDIAELALIGTKWESALHLCRQQDVTVLFSAKPQVSKLLKLTKKCPQLVLMAAIINDRFMSLDDLKEYNRLPNLDTLRAHLCHTLSLATKSMTDKTLYPILSLTNNIDVYVKDQNK